MFKNIFAVGIALCILLSLAGIYAAGWNDGHQHRKVTTVHEWALPARFEAQGAFTLGCALWHVPYVMPYGTKQADGSEVKNLGIGAIEMEAGGDLLAIVDGPAGEAIIDGEKCGLSVDWSAFPPVERAVPADKNEKAY